MSREFYRWARFVVAISMIGAVLIVVVERSEKAIAGDMQAARQALEENKYDQAIALYTRIIERRIRVGVLRPDLNTIDAQYGRGTAYIAGGRFGDAINDFSSAIVELSSFDGLNQYKAKLYDSRGMLYFRVGTAGVTVLSREDLERAALDYTRAIEIDPLFIRSHANRAVANVLLGRNREAIDDCDAYLKHDAKFAEMFYVRGTAKLALKEGSGLADIRTAAKMGHGWAQELLRRSGVSWQ